jgi:hypothetical protein
MFFANYIYHYFKIASHFLRNPKQMVKNGFRIFDEKNKKGTPDNFLLSDKMISESDYLILSILTIFNSSKVKFLFNDHLTPTLYFGSKYKVMLF